MTSSVFRMAFLALVTESLQYWITYFVSWYKDFPASVSCIPRCVRRKSCKPRFSSSKLICLITAGGEINNFSAALLKLPDFATQRNVSNWGLYKGPTFPFTKTLCSWHVYTVHLYRTLASTPWEIPDGWPRFRTALFPMIWSPKALYIYSWLFSIYLSLYADKKRGASL